MANSLQLIALLRELYLRKEGILSITDLVPIATEYSIELNELESYLKGIIADLPAKKKIVLSFKEINRFLLLQKAIESKSDSPVFQVVAAHWETLKENFRKATPDSEESLNAIKLMREESASFSERLPKLVNALNEYAALCEKHYANAASLKLLRINIRLEPLAKEASKLVSENKENLTLQVYWNIAEELYRNNHELFKGNLYYFSIVRAFLNEAIVYAGIEIPHIQLPEKLIINEPEAIIPAGEENLTLPEEEIIDEKAEEDPAIEKSNPEEVETVQTQNDEEVSEEIENISGNENVLEQPVEAIEVSIKADEQTEEIESQPSETEKADEETVTPGENSVPQEIISDQEEKGREQEEENEVESQDEQTEENPDEQPVPDESVFNKPASVPDEPAPGEDIPEREEILPVLSEEKRILPAPKVSEGEKKLDEPVVQTEKKEDSPDLSNSVSGKKKSKKSVLIIGLMAILLLAGAGTFWFFTERKNEESVKEEIPVVVEEATETEQPTEQTAVETTESNKPVQAEQPQPPQQVKQLPQSQPSSARMSEQPTQQSVASQEKEQPKEKPQDEPKAEAGGAVVNTPSAASGDGSFDALLKKAKAGDASAQYKVGQCYEKGNGVSADIFEALTWYRKARVNGSQEAKLRLIELGY